MGKEKGRLISLNLDEKDIKKLDKLVKDSNLSSRANAVHYLIFQYENTKSINKVLESIDSNLVGAKLSSRQSEKNTEMILDIINTLFIYFNNYFTSFKYFYRRENNKHSLVKKAEMVWNERLTQYKKQNREQTYNKRKKESNKMMIKK